jgi:DNA-binding Lrp family transcriptional regulator
MLLKAITEIGGTAKAPELGQMLDFPERTIRYRLKRLKEKGYLYHKWPQTLDAKLGLGEIGLFVELTEEHRYLSREFFNCFKNLNVHYATYGLLNGYFTAGAYPKDRPQIIDMMIKALKRLNIITNYYRFDTLDFVPLSADLSKYNPETGWSWNWREWVEQSEREIKSEDSSGFDFVLDHGTMNYDHKDIAILASIKKHGDIRPKEISKLVGLSDTQVRSRMQRLRAENVLRGSVWLTPPSPDTIIFYTFVKTQSLDDPALACFRLLPFRREIFADKPNRFAIRITMNSGDLVGYMKAFETLRNHFQSYFFQTVVNRTYVPEGMHSQYNLFNESTGRWEFPMEEYIQNLEKFIEDF